MFKNIKGVTRENIFFIILIAIIFVLCILHFDLIDFQDEAEISLSVEKTTMKNNDINTLKINIKNIDDKVLIGKIDIYSNEKVLFSKYKQEDIILEPQENVKKEINFNIDSPTLERDYTIYVNFFDDFTNFSKNKIIFSVEK